MTKKQILESIKTNKQTLNERLNSFAVYLIENDSIPTSIEEMLSIKFQFLLEELNIKREDAFNIMNKKEWHTILYNPERKLYF